MNLRLVVLLSGFGGNLQAFIDREHQGQWGAHIVGVISNDPKAYGLERAKRAMIPTRTLDHLAFPKREAFDHALLQAVMNFKPDLVLLAGFMRILSAAFIEPLKGRILNIHPSLLPAYPGLHTHERVLADQEPWHGVTVHWVTPELDAGPIVGQVRLPVFWNDTVETLKARVSRVEHYLYPSIVERLACGSIRFSENHHSDLETYDPTTDSFIKYIN